MSVPVGMRIDSGVSALYARTTLFRGQRANAAPNASAQPAPQTPFAARLSGNPAVRRGPFSQETSAGTLLERAELGTRQNETRIPRAGRNEDTPSNPALQREAQAFEPEVGQFTRDLQQASARAGYLARQYVNSYGDAAQRIAARLGNTAPPNTETVRLRVGGESFTYGYRPTEPSRFSFQA